MTDNTTTEPPPDGDGFSPDFYRQLLESAPDGIVVVDSAGIIRLVNRQAEALFGWARAELIGQPVEILVPARARAAHPRYRSGFAAHPATRPMAAGFDLTALRSDGSELPVDISLSPLRTGDETWVAAAVRDATDRKVAEGALVAANEQLTITVAEMERQGRELALVNEMGDILQSCLTAAEAYTVIASFAQRVFPGETGGLFVPDESHTMFSLAVGWGNSGSGQFGSFAAEQCWAIRRGRPHRSIDGIECHHRWPDLAPSTRRRTLCLPLTAQGIVLGLLHLSDDQDNTARSQRSDDALERVATTVAEHLALALANLRLRETLHSRSIHDGLTGVFNRGHLDDCVANAVRSAACSHEPVAVIAVDVDHFKRYNDTAGHGAGDSVLRHVAAVLSQSIRPDDMVFRQGGDEFLVLLPGTGADVAATRAEAIRDAIRTGTVDLTVSAGVAGYPAHASDAAGLLEAADSALYEAKESGRDRVSVARALPGRS